VQEPLLIFGVIYEVQQGLLNPSNPGNFSVCGRRWVEKKGGKANVQKGEMVDQKKGVITSITKKKKMTVQQQKN